MTAARATHEVVITLRGARGCQRHGRRWLAVAYFSEDFRQLVATLKDLRAKKLDEVILGQSGFADLDTVGFGVAYVLERDSAAPRVGLATVDLATSAEDTVEIQPGDTFQVGGETWQLAEFRKPAEPDWSIVLRRVPA
jgi:hypothetical protein